MAGFAQCTSIMQQKQADSAKRTMGGFALKSVFSASAASAAADGSESGLSSFVMKAVRCTSAPCGRALRN